MTQNGQREERLLFAFDLSPEWVVPCAKYGIETTGMNARPHHLLGMLFRSSSCHLTEEEMKADRVLPTGLPKLPPHVLLSAIDY